MVPAGSGPTWNKLSEVSLPPALVTAIGPSVTPEGTVAWSVVSEGVVNDAETPLKATKVVRVKFVPPITTVCPMGAVRGRKKRMSGLTTNTLSDAAVPRGVVTESDPVWPLPAPSSKSACRS